MIFIYEKLTEIMTVQTIHFFSRMVVWTAPISKMRKLKRIGTALDFQFEKMDESQGAMINAYGVRSTAYGEQTKAYGVRSKAKGRKPALFALVLCCVFSTTAFANNLSITNVSLRSKNVDAGTIAIEFDISWENSWKDATNSDAVWVFAKYCTANCADGSTGTWHHATLANFGTNPAGFSGGKFTPMDVIVPGDEKGAFIQRSGTGTGTVANTFAKLTWNYSADGVSDADANGANTRIRVFGIEMTYIPSGAFYIGDGNGSSESNYAFHQNGVDNTAVQITGTPKSITVDANGFDDIDSSPLSINAGGITGNSSWPTGYKAFYLMKYELSQGQYVQFLNMLTRTQQGTRVKSTVSGSNVTNNFVMSDTTYASFRSTIQCSTTGNGTSPTRVIFNAGGRDSRAASTLSWMDQMAYADWAALRPFTELEYEKAARGTAAPVYGEFAWGTTTITQCATISGTEDGTETCATSGGNCNHYGLSAFSGGDGDSGALRTGIFATASSNTREKAGAGFYGNLDLSGNLWEHPVTVGNAAGRAFTGTHGDGTLSTNGNANVSNWPGYSSGEVTGATGMGFRGGDWGYGASFAKTSVRLIAANSYPDRTSSDGGRLARTAP